MSTALISHATDAEEGCPAPDVSRDATDRRRIERRWLLLIFLIACALRLFYLAYFAPAPLQFDQSSYCGVALWVSGQVERDDRSTEKARYYFGSRGPGYPAFLGVLFSLLPFECWPSHVWLLRSVQAVMGALTCVLVYLVGKRVASHRAGIIAALLTAAYPALIVYTGHALSENLAIFLQMMMLAALLRGLQTGRWAWLLLGGLVAVCAVLSRSTLLPSVPFLVAGILLTGPSRSRRRRIGLTAAFAVPLFLGLAAWRAGAARLGVDSVVGSRGVERMLEVMNKACDPDFVGWYPDKGSLKGMGDRWLDEVPLLYPVAVALDLVFSHVWYAETLWLGFQHAPDAVMHAIKRTLVILGIAGLGLAFIRWRQWGLLLLLIPPFAVMWIKWIELRHALPFMPIVFLLAAFFIDNAWSWVRPRARVSRAARMPVPSRRYATGDLYATSATDSFSAQTFAEGPRPRTSVLLTIGLAATLFVWFACPLAHLATPLPEAHPFTLAVLSTILVLGLDFGWGVIVLLLARPTLGTPRAAIVGLVPAVIFALLLASHAYTGSDPCWRAWTVDLRLPARQEIRIPNPIRQDEVVSAYWLIDLKTDEARPPLKFSVNNKPRPLFGGRPASEALITQSGHNDQLMPGWVEGLYPRVAFHHPLRTYQQWWLLPADLVDIASRNVVVIDIALDTGLLTDDDVPDVYVGGTFVNPDGVIHGPTLRRSLYRWLVLKDWRLRQPLELTSDLVKSRFGDPDAGSFDARATNWKRMELARSIEKTFLSRELDRNRARFNIHLWVRFKDGRKVLY
ncbi:MAG: glycosyltransferase family 39 protein [Phycisphaerae bacterium]|nr:glycosyltransferase family 39 protein [Phycisphaerae bacterium]